MNDFANQIKAAPKVALHDHLDGGLRASTVLELAKQIGRELPAATDGELADWFYNAADSGSLPRYLETFDVTVAVTQTAPTLRRIAHEAVEDLANDGVVYAELRWAPLQHLAGGLTTRQAIAAVAQGLESGMSAAKAAGHAIVVRQILTALRHHDPSTEIAELVTECRDLGVVGFDLAGPEQGFGASRYSASTALVKARGGHVTIHAGEADGPSSIQDALECGAERIGHGVRLVEDADLTGAISQRVLAHNIALEVCPSSNLQTGVADTLEAHPVNRLVCAGFPVTLSCDNRLMSRTSLSREFQLMHDTFGWQLADVATMTVRAMAHAFCDQATKERLLQEVIIPHYANLGVQLKDSCAS